MGISSDTMFMKTVRDSITVTPVKKNLKIIQIFDTISIKYLAGDSEKIAHFIIKLGVKQVAYG